MLYWTRHVNFGRFENDIYDASAIIIKNPLNSIVLTTRQLNDASNFTLKCSSIFR